MQLVTHVTHILHFVMSESCYRASMIYFLIRG